MSVEEAFNDAVKADEEEKDYSDGKEDHSNCHGQMDWDIMESEGIYEWSTYKAPHGIGHIGSHFESPSLQAIGEFWWCFSIFKPKKLR